MWVVNGQRNIFAKITSRLSFVIMKHSGAIIAHFPGGVTHMNMAMKIAP